MSEQARDPSAHDNDQDYLVRLVQERPVPFLFVYALSMPPFGNPLQLDSPPNAIVSIRSGPFSFNSVKPTPRYGESSARLSMVFVQTTIPEGAYLTVQVSVNLSTSGTAWAEAGSVADPIAGVLETRWPGLLHELVFAGLIVIDGGPIAMMGEGPIRLTVRKGPQPHELQGETSALVGVLQRSSADERERLALASRWLTKAAVTTNRIDKLIALWTVLEVFAGGTDVSTRSARLIHERAYQDVPPQEVKDRLMLGRAEGLRGDIVHKGIAFVSSSEFETRVSAILERLEPAAGLCVRLLGGVTPTDATDRFLRDSGK